MATKTKKFEVTVTVEVDCDKIQEWKDEYPKAEVTLGGVETGELSSKTMESRKVPGLYFIGEVVDVTGWLGGYNFQWAWASAHACGTAI
jgi:predicted flavoprotein YhiN